MSDSNNKYQSRAHNVRDIKFTQDFTMPQIENGKTVEEFYWDRIREMSPAERFHKAVRMNAEVRTMIEYQIRQKSPEIDERSLKFAVARCRYWDEPKILAMLDKAQNEKTGEIQ